MSAIDLGENVHISDSPKLRSLNSIRQEVEIVNIKSEPIWEESLSNENEVQNEGNQKIVDPQTDETEKVWSKEDLTTWMSYSQSEDSDDENDSTECIFSVADTKLNEIKVKNVTWNTHSIINESYQTENTKGRKKCANETHSSVPVTWHKCESEKVTPQKHNAELKRFKCHMCNYNTHRKGILQIHIDSVHLKLKLHKCHLCDHRSSKKSDLQSHIDSVHLKLKRHKCQLCDFRASRKGNLQTHIDSVHLRLRHYECHLCDFRATQKISLQNHIDCVHLKLKIYECYLCDFNAPLKCKLRSHINVVHLKLKHHKCHLCDYRSSKKGDLQNHVDSVHLKLKKHKCHLCDYCSSWRGNLRRHINSDHFKTETS